MKKNNALELIPEYVLGTLSDAELAEIDAAVADSTELQREVSATADALAALATALPPVQPSANVKLRLLQSITGQERYMPFASALARFFDLAVERVQELIRLIDDPKTEWTDGPLPGIRLMHFSGGPATAAADVGFVWLPKGLAFPWHRHRGREVNYILEGSVTDFDGTVYGPGEALVKEAGSEHEFLVGDRDTLIGVVVEGFDILPYGRPQT